MRANRHLCVAVLALFGAAALFAGDPPVAQTRGPASPKPDSFPVNPPPPANIPPDLVPLAHGAKDAFDRSDYAAAEKIYRQILEKAPDNLYILSNLGVVLLREGKNQAAEELFKKAIALAPKDGFSHSTLGIIYFNDTHWDDAMNELIQALSIDPNNATACNYLGITASQKGWEKAAVASLERAIALDPNYTDAHFNLAVVFATMSPPNKVQAAEYYRRALQLGAERDSALEQLIGPVPWSTTPAKPNEASFSDRDHSAPSAPHVRPIPPALKATPGAAPEKPGSILTQSSTPPVLPPALLPLARDARDQFQRGNYLEAERIYRRILEQAPDNLYTLSNLGVVLFRAGKNKEAEDAFQKAIKTVPADGFSHCTLGIVYYQEAKYDAAATELTKALAIDPNNITAHNYLGIVAAQQGWHEVAEREMKKARELDGGDDHEDPKPTPTQGDILTPLEQERLQSPTPAR